ncbi:MAG: alpha/beta fold hydrolase [Acidimicrobiales bacterium]
MAIETIEIEANGLSFSADAGFGPLTGDAGELVVFLHGFPHSRHTWRAEIAALDELGHRVVAFDQRGYSPGARPGAIDDYRVEHLVSDVFAVADSVAGTEPGGGDPKFHLVGHDWGGQLGWVIAGLYPERLHSLSVISRPHPVAFIKAMTSDPDQAERSKHHRSFQRPEATAERLVDNGAPLRALLESWGAGPADIEAYLEVLGTHEALDAAINWYRAMSKSTPQPADVPASTVPTLYVWGNEDASVGRAGAEGTADLVQGPYRFAEVPGGSHCITDQSPGVFTDLLLEHLSSV